MHSKNWGEGGLFLVKGPHPATGFFDFILIEHKRHKSNPDPFRLLSHLSGLDSCLLPGEVSLSRGKTSLSSLSHMLGQYNEVMHDHRTLFTLFLLLHTVASSRYLWCESRSVAEETVEDSLCRG